MYVGLNYLLFRFVKQSITHESVVCIIGRKVINPQSLRFIIGILIYQHVGIQKAQNGLYKIYSAIIVQIDA